MNIINTSLGPIREDALEELHYLESFPQADVLATEYYLDGKQVSRGIVVFPRPLDLSASANAIGVM